MKKPLVTVFIAAYNAEKYIEQCLISLQKQTYENLEILVVDDGSTDNTYEIVNKFCENDSRIIIYKNEQNSGLPYTRNKGLTLAKGEYFAILDADDIAIETRIEKQLAYMEENLLDVVSTDYIINGYGIKRKINVELLEVPMITKLMYYCPILNSSSMIRIEFLKANEITYDSDCKIAQDYKLWTEIALANGQFGHLREYLVEYRTGHENISKKSYSNINKRKSILSKILVSYLNKLGIKFTEKQNEIYTKFFADTYIFEKYSREDVIEILALYSIMKENSIFSNLSHSQMLFEKFIRERIIKSSQNSFHEKKCLLKILGDEGLESDQSKELLKFYIRDKSIKAYKFLIRK